MSLRSSSRQQYDQFRHSYRTRQDSDDAEDTEQQSSSERRRYLRQYREWLWPHRYTILGLLILSLVVSGLDLTHPLLLKYIVDHVLLEDDRASSHRIGQLHLAGGVFLIVITIGQLIGLIQSYRQRVLNSQVVLALRRSLFRTLSHLPLRRISDMKTGGIISRLSGDVDTTTGLIQMAILSPALSGARILIATVVLFVVNWRLAWTALTIIPGIVLISLIVAQRVRPIYRALRRDAEHIDGRVGETFSGIRVVRAFQRESRELFAYLVGRHTMVRKNLFANRRELILWTSWGFLMAAINVVIVWYGGYLQITGRASVGDIMAFQWYTFLLLNPVWNLVNSYSELQRSLAAMERVFEVLDMEQDKPDRPDAVPAPETVTSIQFDHVWFSYHEGQPVISDLDFCVPGGSVVALVGRSGSGKTTVTDLVARFHDPTEGRILLNGTDVRQYRLASYRQLLGVVQQDVFLFDGSIRDNIAYGRPKAALDEIEFAAKRANADEFISLLPHGYDSIVGERGIKLSGGQRQRLAIARAFLASPQILILDEATSNLDSESEQLIQESFSDLLAGRTTFVIAHRLSTIRRATLILVMDQGRIIEQGNHRELMSLGNHYYRMVQYQNQPDF